MAKFKSIENEEQLFTSDLELDDLINMAINKIQKENSTDDEKNNKTKESHKDI